MGKGRVEVRFQHVEVDALVVPADRVRHIGSERGMEQLRRSIAERGVLVPLVVAEEGETWRVVCGCRRALCARSVGLATVPALVVRGPAEWEAWAAYAENSEREAVNPADEGRWLAGLLERLGGDQKGLAEVLGVSEAWLSGRLRIATWPEDVREALESGSLPYAVCREFAQIGDAGERGLCIRQARSSGCSARQAAEWRRGAELHTAPLGSRAGGTGAALPAHPPPGGSAVNRTVGKVAETERVGKGTPGGASCAACGEAVPVGEAVSLSLCSRCHAELLRVLGE